MECIKCHDKNLKMKEIDKAKRNCFGYNEEDKKDIFKLDHSFLPNSDE